MHSSKYRYCPLFQLNSAVSATCWALRNSESLPPFNGPLPQPNDGILAAIIGYYQLSVFNFVYFFLTVLMINFLSNCTLTGWSQLQQTVIVNTSKFLPLYLHISGGHVNARLTQENRAGIQYGDQFFQDIRPHPPFRLGIPRIAALIQPTLEVTKTTECACTDNIPDANDETCVMLQLPFPRVSLQHSINLYMNSMEVQVCYRCGQTQRRKTTKAFRNATPVIAVSIERVDHATGERIDLDANITSPYITLPFMAEGLETRYELASALLRTTGVHYVSLLRHFNTNKFYRVSDNHEPTVLGPQEIRKAEIFLFIRVN